MYRYTLIHLQGKNLGSYLTLQGCLNGNGELFMKLALAQGVGECCIIDLSIIIWLCSSASITLQTETWCMFVCTRVDPLGIGTTIIQSLHEYMLLLYFKYDLKINAQLCLLAKFFSRDYSSMVIKESLTPNKPRSTHTTGSKPHQLKTQTPEPTHSNRHK